jgi:hypothetical protein
MAPFLQQLLAYLGLYPAHSPAPPSQIFHVGSAKAVASEVLASEALVSEALVSEALEREIRAQRKFSLAEAIGREGGSFMKGESAIPRPLRATAAINQFIVAHLHDPASALSSTLQAWAKDDIRVARQLDRPLVALTQIIEGILANAITLCEFARQVAIAHSQLTGDRVVFAPELTHEPIKAELLMLLGQLQAKASGHTQPETTAE